MSSSEEYETLREEEIVEEALTTTSRPIQREDSASTLTSPSSPSTSTSVYETARSESTTYYTAKSLDDVVSLTSTIKGFDDEDADDDGDTVDGGEAKEEDTTGNNDMSLSVTTTSDTNGQHDLTSGSWLDVEEENEKAWIDHSSRELSEDERDHLMSLLRAGDINGLKFLARSPGGFKTDEMRRFVWPLLVGRSVYETNPRPDAKTLREHPFYNQVVLDVNRSLARFPPSVQESQRLSMQDQLVILIMRLLIKRPSLFYYQGFHDICVTCLLILGEERAFHVLDSLSQSHLKSFMAQSMEKTSAILEVIPVIIEKEDKELSEFLTKSGVGTIFALSWVITWYSHVLKNYDTVGRLFDTFICSDKLMPVYVATSLVLDRKEDILTLDCDMASVFQYLSRFLEGEEDNINFEKLLEKSFDLLEKYNPRDIEQQARKRYELSMRVMKKSNKAPFPFSVIWSVTTFLFKSKGLATFSVIALLVSFIYQFVYNRETSG